MPNKKPSGYVQCACRDCFEIAIDDGEHEPTLCHECEKAGCDWDGSTECRGPSAYGGSESQFDDDEPSDAKGL
jgi:hypothetical protein